MPSTIASTRLHLVTNRSLCIDRSLEDVVEKAVLGGVDVVHLRERDISSNGLYQLATNLRCITLGRALLMINDRIDIALAIGADGVHLPGTSIPVYAVRKLAGKQLLIGKSVHSIKEAIEAESDLVDYIVLGTIYKTNTHPEKSASGPELIESVTSMIDLPVYAIGGIDARNAPEVMRAGASGIVAMRAILQAHRPEQAARILKATLTEKQRIAGTL